MNLHIVCIEVASDSWRPGVCRGERQIPKPVTHDDAQCERVGESKSSACRTWLKRGTRLDESPRVVTAIFGSNSSPWP